MAFIDIITNNQSRDLRNATTIADNWVYVPGNTITGDYTKPYAITSLEDFKELFGTYSPEGSITYEYVSGILAAGLPVLFRRIVSEDPNMNSVTATSLVTKASFTLVKDSTDQVKITEKYGGSFGNRLYVHIRKTNTAYYLDVKLDDSTLLETHKLMPVIAGEPITDTNARLITALDSYTSDSTEPVASSAFPEKFERIVVEVKNKDKETFDITQYMDGTSDRTPIILENGKDIQSDNLSIAEIRSFVYPYFLAKASALISSFTSSLASSFTSDFLFFLVDFLAASSASFAFSASDNSTLEIAVRLNSILQSSSTFKITVFSFTDETTP